MLPEWQSLLPDFSSRPLCSQVLVKMVKAQVILRSRLARRCPIAVRSRHPP